jgi:hypothetical protein
MSPPIITNTHPIYYLSIFYINHYHTHPNPIVQVDAYIQISTLNYQQSPSTYHAYNHTTPPHQTCGSHQNPLIYYNTYVHMSMQRSKQINIQYIITNKNKKPTQVPDPLTPPPNPTTAKFWDETWPNHIRHHALPYRTIPYHTIPYHTIPYHTIPYHTIPYNTMMCNTIP